MVELTEDPIETEVILRRVFHPDSGAVLLFVGTTRRWTEGRETLHLEYQAYQSMAVREMQILEETARARWSLKEVQIVHRLGEVSVGQVSVAIAVSSPHRRDAFEAGQWLIDELKRSVPIWKKENWREEGEAWIHPSQEPLNLKSADSSSSGSPYQALGSDHDLGGNHEPS